jgi:hypothetical protein
MATLKVLWVLPVVRVSGKPLDPADIAGVDLELSADGGENFVSFGLKQGTSFDFTELEPGTWVVRGTVVDTAQRRSASITASKTIADETNPGALQSLTLDLA